MDLLVTAFLLPLAQAAPSVPHPGETAVRIFKSFFAGDNLLMALVGVALAVVIQVLACGISAKVVVGDDRGSFGNAFKVWLLYLLVAVGMILLLAVFVPALVVAENMTAAYAVLAGASVLTLAIAFLLPMKIFSVGLPSSLGFLVVALILIFAANAGLNRAKGQPAFGKLPTVIDTLRSPEKRDQWLAELIGPAQATSLDAELDQLASPEERAKPIPERQDNLRKVYEALDAQLKALPPNDAKAQAEYERLRAKYEELVRVLKADYAASKGKTP